MARGPFWGRGGAAALASAAVVVSLLTGCAAASPPDSGGSAEPAPSASATPAAPEWARFTTKDGLASWEMPPDWTATLTNGPDEMGMLGYEIDAPSDRVRLRYGHRNWGLGGPGCIPDVKPAYPYEVLDETDIPIEVTATDWEGAVPARVAYEAIEFPDHVGVGLGDTDALQGIDDTACEFLHFMNTTSRAQIVLFDATYPQSDGTWGDQSFATLAEAKAYMDTDEYATVTRILGSLQVEQPAAGLDGDYLLAESADCGTFDLSGQTLSVTGGTATITTPGQVLTGTALESGGKWNVAVQAADAKTKVQLSGTVVKGVYSGSGNYGGIFPSGETGWTCDVPQFTATPR